MSLEQWYPYKIKQENGQQNCYWLNFENIPFIHPFFDETILKSRKLENNSRYHRPLSTLKVLKEWSINLEPVQPNLIIFHVSRCGSTLLSQLLGMDERIISLAEVPFFDDILRLPYKDSSCHREVTELFKAAISFYGRRRSSVQEHLIIKTDSWHIFFIDQFKKLYPQIPFILLYRRPDEVIHSHRKLRGMQAVPGLIEPEVFGFSKEAVQDLDLDAYMAKVLEQYYSAYLNALENDDNILLLNYSEGAATLLEKTLNFAGITVREELKSKMLERSQYHSKYPEKTFSEMQNNDMVPEYMQTAFTLYEQLEILRMKKSF